jgi:hypothetical protein
VILFCFHRDFSPSIDLHVHGYYFKLMDIVQKEKNIVAVENRIKRKIFGE